MKVSFLGKMSEAGKGGFVLTPSRLGKPPGEGPTKPKFTGKLGVYIYYMC